MQIEATPLLLAMADVAAGVFEIAGPERHPRIGQALDLVGFHGADDKVAHCSAMMCLWHHECGWEHPNSAAARRWLDVGEHVRRQDARPGDVVVEWRGHPTNDWRGHVYMLVDWPTNPLQLTGVGANQREDAMDKVCIQERLVDKILDIRRIQP